MDDSGEISEDLLLCAIAPRPQVWVTTLDAETGDAAMAAFSAITIISQTPPTILLVVQPRSDGRRKQTAANILASRAFAVNVPRADHLEALMRSADPEVAREDRVAVSCVELISASHIEGWRFGDAAYGLECRLERHETVNLGVELFFATVVAIHLSKSLGEATDPKFVGALGYEWFVSERGLQFIAQPYLAHEK